MPLYKAFREIQHIQILTFSGQSSIEIPIFSAASFWMTFFQILAHSGAKTLDFGITLAPSWTPNDAQNRPSGAKDGLRKLQGGLHCADLLPR